VNKKVELKSREKVEVARVDPVSLTSSKGVVLPIVESVESGIDVKAVLADFESWMNRATPHLNPAVSMEIREIVNKLTGVK
jgi:hypothetical protein